MSVLHIIARKRASGRVIDVAIRSAPPKGSTSGPLCGNLSMTPDEWNAFRCILTASPLARGTMSVEEPREEVLP